MGSRPIRIPCAVGVAGEAERVSLRPTGVGLLCYHLHICRAELACDVSLAGGGGFGYGIAADRHKNGHIMQVSE